MLTANAKFNVASQVVDLIVWCQGNERSSSIAAIEFGSREFGPRFVDLKACHVMIFVDKTHAG